jgi:putative ABC transport system permease protein
VIAKALRLTGLALKQLLRHRMRTVLTTAGVGAGMFLFTAVESLQRSLQAATQQTASDTSLVVYRENRFCPATSRLPEFYEDELRRIPGVEEVIPIKITVNNCGASLDVITFRGVPGEQLFRYAPDISLVDGTLDSWMQRDDGALLGKNFAGRRGLSTGDAFEAAGVRVSVTGIIDSPHPQDNNVAYVHLPFLQQTSRHGLGVVTQFNVRVADANELEAVATRIDERFRSEAEPTNTQPEKAFFAQTARELIDLAGFTRWIGYGAVIAVFALVANAILLVVRGRVRENAILQTLGFPETAVGFLVLAEGALLGLLGGGVGVVSSVVFLNVRNLTLGSEGLALGLKADSGVLLIGILLALTLGLMASVWPAIVAIRKPIVQSLRS